MAAKKKFFIWGIIAILVIAIALTGTLLLMIHPYFYGLNKIGARNDKVYVYCTEFYSCTVGRLVLTRRHSRANRNALSTTIWAITLLRCALAMPRCHRAFIKSIPLGQLIRSEILDYRLCIALIRPTDLTFLSGRICQ